MTSRNSGPKTTSEPGFSPHEHPWLRVSSFRRSSSYRVRLSESFSHIDLSVDGKDVLLSGDRLDEDPRIAIVNLESQSVRHLDLRGSNAIWGPDGSILFLVGKLALWQKRAKQAPTMIMHVYGNSESKYTSYTTTPVPSHDRCLIYWPWGIDSASGPRLASSLIDLVHGEFRILRNKRGVNNSPGWWHSVAWVR